MARLILSPLHRFSSTEFLCFNSAQHQRASVKGFDCEGVLGDSGRIYVLGSGFNLALDLHKTHRRIFHDYLHRRR